MKLNKFKKIKIVRQLKNKSLLRPYEEKKNTIETNFYLVEQEAKYRLKKIFNIIFQFHARQKRIMFIGKSLPNLKYLKTALSKTKHLFIPKSVWVKGLLSNPYKCFYSLLITRVSKRNKNINFLMKLKKRIDLVVVLDEPTSLQMLKEGFLKGIPTIALNSDINNSSAKSTTYRMYGNYNFIEKPSVFYNILASILKRKLVFCNTKTKEEIREERMTMEERWKRFVNLQKKSKFPVSKNKNYNSNKKPFPKKNFYNK